MTLFPCISTLFTVNLDRDIRTGNRTQGASCAFSPFVPKADRTISPGIVLLRRSEQALFACLDAEVAFLAQFLVDGDISLQRQSLLIA
jgi:hypothetical protein